MKRKASISLLRNIVWAIIIFILCTLPRDKAPNLQINIPYLDKLAHFGMFFVMAVLLYNELDNQTTWSRKKINMVSIGVVFLYGGIIEILQENIFRRSGDVWDLTADVLGACVGCMVYPYIKRLKNKLFKSQVE